MLIGFINVSGKVLGQSNVSYKVYANYFYMWFVK